MLSLATSPASNAQLLRPQLLAVAPTTLWLPFTVLYHNDKPPLRFAVLHLTGAVNQTIAIHTSDLSAAPLLVSPRLRLPPFCSSERCGGLMTDSIVRTHTNQSNRAKAKDALERKTIFRSVLDNPFRIQWYCAPCVFHHPNTQLYKARCPCQCPEQHSCQVR